MFKKGFSTILIVVIILVVIVVGVLAYTESSRQKYDPAEWETYYNEDYGFEMKYPIDWSVYLDDSPTMKRIIFSNMDEKERAEQINLFETEDLTFDDVNERLADDFFIFEIKIIQDELEQWLKEQIELSEMLHMDLSYRINSISVGDNDADKITFYAKQGNLSSVIALPSYNGLFKIETMWPQECRMGNWRKSCKVFKEMFSSFRFLNSDDMATQAKSFIEMSLMDDKKATLYLVPKQEECIKIEEPAFRCIDIEKGTEHCSGEYKLVLANNKGILDVFNIEEFKGFGTGDKKNNFFDFFEGQSYDGTLYLQKIQIKDSFEYFVSFLQTETCLGHNSALIFRIDSNNQKITQPNFFLENGQQSPHRRQIWVGSESVVPKIENGRLMSEICYNSGILQAIAWDYKDGNFYRNKAGDYEIGRCH